MYNFHTHTFRCHHAEGSDEDYVLQAIKNGYDTIGFSDHAPYLFPNGYVSSFRMLPSDAKDYARSVNALKNKYQGKIDIKLGFELEYYPKLIDDEIEFLKSFNYDYLILGQHYTNNEYEEYAKYSGAVTTSVAVLDKYISQVILGAKSGLFTYVAHPDLIRFNGNNDIYKAKMRYLATELKKIGIPLEFNFLGFTAKRNYPNPDFWQIVKEVGNDVVIGLDAHKPQVYTDKENLKKAKDYLKSLDIIPLDEIELVK